MENINNDKSKQSESTPDKSSNHSDPSSYPNQSIATPKQDPLSLYDQILQTYHSAVQAFEHFIQTFDSFQSQCRQLNTAIRSLDLNDSIDKRLHTPLFEYSNNLNTSYPYTASLIRNHSTQFQGFAALGIWYPLSSKTIQGVINCNH